MFSDLPPFDILSVKNLKHNYLIYQYSNGGHLLSVVCGKLIQLFHMYDLDYSRNDLSGEIRDNPN